MSFRFCHRRTGLALAALLILAASAPAQVALRFKFQDGETLSYVSDNKMKIKTDVGGIKINMNMDQTIHMGWTIQKVNADGSARIAVKVTRMIMTVEAPPPLGMAVIDSDDKKDPENLLAQQFSKLVRTMVGQEITATMSPLGEFTDVKTPAELQKGFKEATGGIGLVGGIEQMMGGGLVLLKEEVNKGKSWSHKSDSKSDMLNLTMEMKYTYEGKDGEAEKISVIPKMTIEPGKGGGPNFKSVDGKNKGHILFDSRAGRITEMQTAQSLAGSVEMMGFAINMEMDIATTLRLKGRK